MSNEKILAGYNKKEDESWSEYKTRIFDMCRNRGITEEDVNKLWIYNNYKFNLRNYIYDNFNNLEPERDFNILKEDYKLLLESYKKLINENKALKEELDRVNENKINIEKEDLIEEREFLTDYPLKKNTFWSIV